MVSDLRIFESDGNSTVRSLADTQTFQNECRDVLTQMLNTVPRGVTLTDEITLLPEKVTYAQLAIEKQKLVFKTNLRVRVLASLAPHAQLVLLDLCFSSHNPSMAP